MLDEEEDLDEAVLVDESDVSSESKIILPKSWLRPFVPPIDPEHDKIIFQQIDVDFYKVFFMHFSSPLIHLFIRATN